MTPSAEWPSTNAALYWQYGSATLKDVDLGFAGRFAKSHAVHSYLAALQAGDAVQLTQVEHKWLLLDAAGVAVGRMASAIAP